MCSSKKANFVSVNKLEKLKQSGTSFSVNYIRSVFKKISIFLKTLVVNLTSKVGIIKVRALMNMKSQRSDIENFQEIEIVWIRPIKTRAT